MRWDRVSWCSSTCSEYRLTNENGPSNGPGYAPDITSGVSKPEWSGVAAQGYGAGGAYSNRSGCMATAVAMFSKKSMIWTAPTRLIFQASSRSVW